MKISHQPHCLIRLVAEDGKIIDDPLVRPGALACDNAGDWQTEALKSDIDHRLSVATMVGVSAMVLAFLLIVGGYVYAFWLVEANFRPH